MVVTIIDYGLGNLFSIHQACSFVEIASVITSDKQTILYSDAIILPGVGAFKGAMNNLSDLDLIDTIHTFIKSSKPLLGICLGMQILFTEGSEYEYCKGLALIEGKVEKLKELNPVTSILKIPHIGWSKIQMPGNAASWEGTILDGITEREQMYFTHSYMVKPAEPSYVLSQTTYCGVTFCSAIHCKNIYAVQFHPERSGTAGLSVYTNFKRIILENG